MMKIKVQDNQTIFDIALQYTGSIDSVMDILLHNGKTDDTLLIDEIIEIPYVVNQSIVDYFAAQGISIATSTEALDTSQYVPAPSPYPKYLQILIPYSTNDTNAEITIVSDSDGTITTSTTTGLNNVTYTKNGSVVNLPFSLAVGDLLRIEFDSASADGTIKLEGSYV